jgi:F-type H+-transporting ATPase subunit c
MIDGSQHCLRGGFMNKQIAFLALVLTAGLVSPAYAQQPGTEAVTAGVLPWLFVSAGFGLAIAAFGGALAQGRAVAAAAEGIARNPGAAGEIRGSLILGLVLIESLVIYSLVVSLILLFVKS